MKKLNRLPKTYVFLGIIILLIIFISLIELTSPRTSNNPISPSPIAKTTGKTVKQEKEEGNVNVVVELLPQQSDSDNLVFNIILDTHSVDLNQFDFLRDVFLAKAGRGSLPLKVNHSGSVHHRRAEVTFKKVETPFSIVLTNLEDIAKREFQFTNI